MAIINYYGRSDISLDKIIAKSNPPKNEQSVSVSLDVLPEFYSTSTQYHTYTSKIPEYDAHEVEFIGAGPGWEIRGVFIPGNSKPYVLRNLNGPEKYRTRKHELIHSEFHDAGIPQSESEVRRITSERTNFKDYYA